MQKIPLGLSLAASILSAQSYLTTTIAGNTSGIGDGGPVFQARFERLSAMAAGPAGDLYVADNGRVRRIDREGVIRTIAGRGLSGAFGDGGPALLATTAPTGISVDGAGNVYIAEYWSPRVRKVRRDGVIVTVAGTGESGFSGDGGLAVNARLTRILSLVAAPDGTLYFYDGTRVRRVTPDGIISTWLSGVSPFDLAVDLSGNLYVSQFARPLLRIDPRGNVTELPLPDTGQFLPFSLAVDAAGDLYIADGAQNRIVLRKADGSFSTVARFVPPIFAGRIALVSGTLYMSDSQNRLLRVVPPGVEAVVEGGIGDGGLASQASLSALDIVTDKAGSIFVADLRHQRIRKIDARGVITTIAGTGQQGYSGDGGPATAASLNNPNAIALSATGEVYFAESGNSRIRKISTSGIISTVAGTGVNGFSGDGGPAVAGALDSPLDVAFDAAGNLYIADSGNHRVRKVTPAGILSTFAGSGVDGSRGDGGPAGQAELSLPSSVAIDGAGNVYVSPFYSGRIRKVTPAGMISSIAELQVPSFIAVDAAGTVYVAQTVLYQIMKIPPGGEPVRFAGIDRQSAFLLSLFTDGGPARETQVFGPAGMTIAPDGALLFVDNMTWIRKIEPANIFPRLVVNAASGEHDFLSPGEIVTIGWRDLGDPPSTIATPVAGRFPAELSGAQVLFDGVAAPLLYVDSRFIRAVIPYGAAGRGGTRMQVVYQGRKSNEIVLALQPAHPGLFPEAIVNADATLNSPGTPASPESLVALYGTGGGLLSPSVVDGTVTAVPGRMTLPVSVRIDGSNAEIAYAGGAPGLIAGVFQINVRVPLNAGSGLVDLEVSIAGAHDDVHYRREVDEAEKAYMPPAQARAL